MSSDISVMRTAICGTLKATADIYMGMLEAGAALISKIIDGIHLLLNKLVWSPKALVYAAIAKLQSQYDQFCPDLSSVDEITNIIMKCAFLNQDALMSPSALFNKVKGAIWDNFSAAVDFITGFLPEFSIGKMFNELLRQIGTIIKFDVNLKKFKDILGCLQAICGIDVEPYLARLNAILNMLYMDSNGAMDFKKILRAGGITPELQQILVDCYEAVRDASIAVAVKITDVAALLNEVKWTDPFDPWPYFGGIEVGF